MDIDVYFQANAQADTTMSIKWVEKTQFAAGCLRNKNILKLRAGMMEKIIQNIL